MELEQGFVLGDVDAFEMLVRRHQGEVYTWIVRIIRDRAAAEDVAVETLWRAWRHRQRFDPHRSFGAWLRRIATNSSIDYLKVRRPEVELPPGQRQPDRAHPAELDEVAQAIESAFARLPAKLRAAATLALVEEVPYEQIASALGISEGAVKSRIFRAVRLLRGHLEQAGIRP
jgi:RNA polymerase sigma-70 factor (ECF subfamily)